MERYQKKFKESPVTRNQYVLFVYKGKSSGIEFNGKGLSHNLSLVLRTTVDPNPHEDVWKALENAKKQIEEKFGSDWKNHYSAMLIDQHVVV